MLEIYIYDGSHRDNAIAKALLDKYQLCRPELMLQITVCTCATELLSATGPRIYILDVVLPDLDGLEAARRIREREPGSVILYLTTSRRMALDAYRVRALNYLLKPAVEEELFAALDEAVEHLVQKMEARFQIKTPDGIRWLLLSQIVYMRPNQHVVEILLKDGSQLSTQNLRVSFSSFVAPLLEQGSFVRPHHSYVVNTAYIDHLTPDALILRDETAIPVSHSKYQDMKAIFQG